MPPKLRGQYFLLGDGEPESMRFDLSLQARETQTGPDESLLPNHWGSSSWITRRAQPSLVGRELTWATGVLRGVSKVTKTCVSYGHRHSTCTKSHGEVEEAKDTVGTAHSSPCGTCSHKREPVGPVSGQAAKQQGDGANQRSGTMAPDSEGERRSLQGRRCLVPMAEALEQRTRLARAWA